MMSEVSSGIKLFKEYSYQFPETKRLKAFFISPPVPLPPLELAPPLVLGTVR